jgi:hypothetical protein
MDGTLRVGLVGLLFAGVMGYLGRGAPPAEGALAEASATVAAVQRITGKGNRVTAVRFELGGAGTFEYPRKAGEIDAIAEALERAGPAPVTVRYAPGSGADPPAVYELTIGRQRLRSYADIAASWRSENRVLRIGALAAGVVGIGALAAWFRRQRRAA